MSRINIDSASAVKGPRGPAGQEGGAGKQGASITKVKVEKDNTLVVWIDGKRTVAGKIVIPVVAFDSGVGGGSGEMNRRDGLGWDPAYTPNKQVVSNTAVHDDGWLMASNKLTSERAAPSPVGDPFYVYDGELTDTQVLAKQVLFGTRYTSPRDGYVTGYRVNTVVGNEYSLYLVRDPLGVAEVEEILTFTGTIDGFQEFGLLPRLVFAGTTFDTMVLVHEPNPTPTITEIDYNYQVVNNVRDPLPGEIVHASKQVDTLLINKTDADSVDQSAFLATLVIGDIISGAGIDWSVQNTGDQGDFVAVSVSPALQGVAGLTTFSFETVSASIITYGRDDGFWVGNEDVRGMLAIDGDYESITPDDNAYGADLLVQEALISADWDIMALSDSVGSSSDVYDVRNDVIGQFSTTVTQNPTGLGDSGKIRIHFGVGGTTSDGEFTVASDGTIECFKNSIQYVFDLAVRVGRSGAGGVSTMVGRLMYAPDGVEVNAVQLSDSFVIEIDNADTVWRENLVLKLDTDVGSKTWFELARNPSGNDSGGLLTNQPDGDLIGWNQSSTAILTISKDTTF
jgi:hypothetical protein